MMRVIPLYPLFYAAVGSYSPELIYGNELLPTFYSDRKKVSLTEKTAPETGNSLTEFGKSSEKSLGPVASCKDIQFPLCSPSGFPFPSFRHLDVCK